MSPDDPRYITATNGAAACRQALLHSGETWLEMLAAQKAEQEEADRVDMVNYLYAVQELQDLRNKRDQLRLDLQV